MTTSPSSGLSAEAKEFVPLLQPSPASIPLYVDENTVASIYPSDQTPVMIQTIYPMMISNTKMTDLSSPTLLPFPEIEFHIQPSQQQQFQIDSSSNTSASTGGTSQIVLLPTNNGNAATSLTAGYYPVPPFLYSPTDPNSAFYPMEFAEQPLINFSMPPSTMMNKSTRISSQQQQGGGGSLARPTSFRQSHGNPSSSYRTNHRVGGITGNSSTNRNSYYDYHSRRNGSTYPPTSYSGRGSNSNSKRISSSYHQQDYHHYYHHPSSRSRGYAQSRSSQYHDEQRKDANDYYNAEKESYPNDSNTSNELNEDGTPFEFRPEDFPSLPINQPNEKMPTPTVPTAKSASSWNTIVSTPRPHSTSPHSVPPSSSQSHDQRSDRSRSFNTKLSSSTPISNSTSQKKGSRANVIPSSQSKSPVRASKAVVEEEKPSSTTTSVQDDGFIQTKQQQRRLKRKNRMKEDFVSSIEPAISSLDPDPRSDNPSTNSIPTDVDHLSEQFTRVRTSIDVQQSSSDRQSSAIVSDVNVQSEREHVPQTDRMKTNRINENDQNSTPSSANMNNSSDTSDYDDAVDNLTDE